MYAVVLGFNLLILEQGLRVTSDLMTYSQFTFYLVDTALIQASMAEKGEMSQYENKFQKPLSALMAT